jgi:hypothetical protein
VNSLPLWKRTPGRSLNSHTVGSSARQDSARPGTMRAFSSVSISLSKIMSLTALFGDSW